MSSSGGPSNADTPTIDDEDDNLHPLWRYVTRFEKDEKGGGNIKWQCNFCKIVKKSSYTRVRSHLLKISGTGIGACTSIKIGEYAELKRLDNEASNLASSKAPKKVPLPQQVAKKRKGCPIPPASSLGYRPLETAFNFKSKDILHTEIARMFYSGGLPFHLARNPYYVSAFTYAANNPLTGYIPPGYNLLRTTLLQREKANIDKLLEPIKFSWKEKGVSIVSDGWSDSQRRPLINFMAVNESGPMFLKAVDCSGEVKDKFFIANLLKEVINEVKHENVVQVITDNAANCKAAGQLIEAQYPSIFWTPCVVHTLNLALKNICAARNTEANQIAYVECNWITYVAEDVVLVKNFILNHSMRLAIFNEFVPLKLLSVADTRFASVIVMLKRFKLIKRGLQAMVISDKWSCYREDNVEKAMFVKQKLLDDLWWDQIDYILSFTSPIYEMLRACDTDKPCLHLVYDMWDTMIENVRSTIYRKEAKRQEEESPFYEVVHQILIDRWNKNNTPLHYLAHSLNPRYYGDDWLNEDPNRVAPHRDPEIVLERTKCLKRFFPDPNDHSKVNIEFAHFSSKTGAFGDLDSIRERSIMEPYDWWVVHGAHTPMLQCIALKLLAQPSSSSCAEKNWSTYSFVHSLKRNKMTPQRAEDLVFIHSNLRLLSRKTPQYKVGETKLWDIGGDTFDSFEDVGVLEVASLSLDEPELEAVVFTDDGDGNVGDDEAEDEIEIV